ncbi:FAD-dependent oxidoreductase [Modestobacter italicus]|nr:FAD-dependent oxidoreductase [Modestobacter marinus]
MVAQLRRWTHTVAARWSRITPADVRWLLIDVAHTVLLELGEQLGHVAKTTLRDRGVEIHLGLSLSEVSDRSAILTDGTVVPTRTVIWGAGVSANPVMSTLGLP